MDNWVWIVAATSALSVSILFLVAINSFLVTVSSILVAVNSFLVAVNSLLVAVSSPVFCAIWWLNAVIKSFKALISPEVSFLLLA